MLYTVIGCKPEMPVSKKKKKKKISVRGRSQQRGHRKQAFRSVENPMHIHRMECAKACFFQSSPKLFTFAALSAPGFSSQFQIA
jgi:hypothetical protein